MKKYILLIAVLLFPLNGYPCGSTEQRFSEYWLRKDIPSKSHFLENYGCSQPMNYSPRNADPVIAKVLAHAIQNDIEPTIIKNVLLNYNCVYGARDLPEYEIIQKFITPENFNVFCNIERLKTIYIVNAEGGLVLRDGPGKDSKRLGALAEGSLVEVIKTIGEWSYIKSYLGKGYVFKPFLEPY